MDMEERETGCLGRMGQDRSRGGFDTLRWQGAQGVLTVSKQLRRCWPGLSPESVSFTLVDSAS